MHVSLGLVRLIGNVETDYACLIQLNSSLDYACIGWLKIAQNWTDFMPEMPLKLGQNNLLSWAESIPYNLRELGPKIGLEKDREWGYSGDIICGFHV